jgi:probable phosphoglycerate mutase
MPPPTIYYIRHGETDWNVAGRLQGRHDVPLNARGRAQANHCGNILRDLFAQIGRHPADFDYVSSPLGRACETMALVRPPLGLPPEGFCKDQCLAEISFGEWEGFTIAELRNRDPKRIATREHDKWYFVPPGGESYESVSRRMGEWTRMAGAVLGILNSRQSPKPNIADAGWLRNEKMEKSLIFPQLNGCSACH